MRERERALCTVREMVVRQLQQEKELDPKKAQPQEKNKALEEKVRVLE